MEAQEIEAKLIENLTNQQAEAVRSARRLELVVAGAGSGKTEVMARRIAWWVAMEGVAKNQIVAFTFTEKAAKEMKYRVRKWIGEVTPSGEDVTLGGMFVGTIHGYCLAKIREYWPDEYHNYDILDDSSRYSLLLRNFNGLLALNELRGALPRSTNGYAASQSDTVAKFFQAYDQLHEHNLFDVRLPESTPPIELGAPEREWCTQARLATNVGESAQANAFAVSAARYYAYIRCRRFLDFATSQSEFLTCLNSDEQVRQNLREQNIHLVVDEVQDINPVQRDLVNALVDTNGKLTAVGDHRQSIYGFRGAKVELIGYMWEEFNNDQQGMVINLQHNFRSTSRIIEIANEWSKSIGAIGQMEVASMTHGRQDRIDTDPSHVAMVEFEEREEEAAWIAEAMRALVPSADEGAEHDKRGGETRGIALSDIAVLVRGAKDVRTYMDALDEAGIPSIVRAGPDLFSQPEVILMLCALAISADMGEFLGAGWDDKSLPKRIDTVLGCGAHPEEAFPQAAQHIRDIGLNFETEAEIRLHQTATLLKKRIIDNEPCSKKEVASLKNENLKKFLRRTADLRRVFPQQLFHWLLSEASVELWDTSEGRGETAMFHLGALSSMVTAIETPGWTNASDYKWQIIGLCQHGSSSGRAPEQPLLSLPDAVTISTIHSVKGLEFAAIFLADVCASRFPSNMARRAVSLPLDGQILQDIDASGLSDNDNHDGERRLMYVALTRAERFLVVSRSGKRKSSFFKELAPIVRNAGGVVSDAPAKLLENIRHAPLELTRDNQLSTSFSEMRYYLACPHDFYLRKVLGFAPTIDQAFGYGRGVHNLMRAVHTEPEKWAELANDPDALSAELRRLIDRGLFYLRYTTGEPADNMRAKGIEVTSDYVTHFVEELSKLEFEPEKEFETLVEYPDEEGGVMISGAIDIVRLDDPPRITLIDFKSGQPESDHHQKLDAEEMALQLGIYAIAAKHELEYEPDRGLVRYLNVDYSAGEPENLEVPLDDSSIEKAKEVVLHTASSIQNRSFNEGPTKLGSDGKLRCGTCDFLGFCGRTEAMGHKQN